MPYLQAVYWDLDGTIANTELEAHLPAFNNSFKDLNLDWSWDKDTYIDLLKINGGKNRIEFFAKNNNIDISENFVIQIHKRKQEHYLNFVNNGAVSLKTGVHRLIKELYSRNIRQFIVTSSSRIQVELLVKNLFGDTNPFEFSVTSDDVDILKPHPMPYLKAIKLSGIKISNSLAIEDSNPGLISAFSANLPTICVKSNLPIVYDNNISIKCLVDTIGDNKNPSKIIKGPKLLADYINYEYLKNFINNFK
tara:strand:+ start:183 stop:932 length:750 start_codon:yes stop_codon:yes gene_type:complete